MSWRKGEQWKRFCVQNDLAQDDPFASRPTFRRVEGAVLKGNLVSQTANGDHAA